MRGFWIMTVIILALFAGVTNHGLADDQTVTGQIKTTYDINGRPINSREQNKGWHRVLGIATLASGVDTITLNKSIADGKQDLSFLADSTYGGRAWSLRQSNTNTYRIIPISPIQFIVKSSDGADTAVVRFLVEGE